MLWSSSLATAPTSARVVVVAVDVLESVWEEGGAAAPVCTAGGRGCEVVGGAPRLEGRLLSDSVEGSDKTAETRSTAEAGPSDSDDVEGTPSSTPPPLALHDRSCVV